MREKKAVLKTSRPRRGKTDPKKETENNVPLGGIVEDLSSYFRKFSHFKYYEKDIQKKYQKYYETASRLPDRWPVEFINRAWGKTKTMRTSTGRRKCWSLAILFQVVKSSQGYDEESEREEETEQSDEKENNQQSGGDPSVYIRIPFSEMSNKKRTVEKDKECFSSDTDEKDKECFSSDTDEKDKECKASNTVAKKSLKSPPKKKQYKLLDKVPSPTQILQKNSYVILYDNQTRNAAWVYEILNESPKSMIIKLNKKDLDTKFKYDASVHPLFQPDKVKFDNNTGYNRGHLAAAANHKWCQEAHDDTYCISNIIPQGIKFNSGLWSGLEKLCREIAKKSEVRNVHVYTGPLYLSSDRNSSDIKTKKCKTHVEYEILEGKAVPTHLFKVIIVENKDGEVLEPECYKMANERENSEEQSPNVEPGLIIEVSNKDVTSGKVIKKDKQNEQTSQIKSPNVEPADNQDDINKNIDKLRDDMKTYKVTIDNIQRDSGLIFEERGIMEEMTEGIWKVHWRKNPAQEGKGTLIEVRVSSSYTDHSDRAVLH